MSTVSATAGAPSAQAIWNRFLSGLDRNGDGSMDAGELAASSSPEKAEKAITAHDANGDGRLDADELPKGAFSPAASGALLDAQEYRDASPEERRADNDTAIAKMFARADIDADGVLSQAEWDAERALSMSRFLDSGELSDVAIIAKGRMTGDVSAGLRPEDFLVGRKLNLEAVPIEELPEDLSKRLAEMRKVAEASSPDGEPLIQVLDPETARADMMAQIEALSMDAAFLTRLIMALGEEGTA